MSKDEMVNAVIDGLAKKGLAVVPADLVEPALVLQKGRERLMKRNKLTPYEIAKFKLLPGAPTAATIKNMVKDGRILDHESFKDRGGKLYITTSAVKRLNVI